MKVLKVSVEKTGWKGKKYWDEAIRYVMGYKNFKIEVGDAVVYIEADIESETVISATD